MPISRMVSWLAASLFLLALVPLSWAQSLERTLMPGAVIKAHAKYEDECSVCHERFNRGAQSKLCADCHKDIRDDINRRAHLHGHMESTVCKECHTEHKGRDARIVQLDKRTFDHKSTGLPLKGAHRKVIREKCESCHAPKQKLRDAPTHCDACHRKDDIHKGGLGKKCDECHSEDTWKEGRFDHDKTHFILTGKHVDTKCKECHVDARYKDTPKECYGCHKKDDAKDGHKGRFNTKCENCHGTERWKDSTFDHERDTHYRLRGKHQKLECTQCHATTLYVAPKTSTRCISCHRMDDQRKGHQGSLGEKCESCHNEREWKTTNFDHDRDTEYPLTGKHRDAKCDSCHKDGLKPAVGEKVRKKLPADCGSCHKETDLEKGHRGHFGNKCKACHNTESWTKILFLHERDTRYALLGKHAQTKCTACHTGFLYAEKLNADCVSCHQRDDKEKGHKGTLGNKCQECHNERGWKVERFDHNRSRFPLTGEHVRVECTKCHRDKEFRTAPRKCNGCHERDDIHRRTLGPACEQCHNSRSWKTWDFDHNKTRFRLDGSHAKLECVDCHKTAVHEKPHLSRSCFSCHSRDDVHEGSFGLQCERCHGTSKWTEVRPRQ